uniref:ATP-binding cassette sub-family G member 1-like protein n=1 Tax=Sogatella furcifera TaxID=113103 RepID=A0A481P1T6_SOGFU|nr:ATP-binding cassette sub-family G member 1-like protein [Sogatella furcifera]
MSRSVANKVSLHDPLCLTFRDLTHEVRCGEGFRFMKETKCLLNGISGEFYSGELSAIIGPSGCGKTTLMDILSGYIELKAGSIHFNRAEENRRVRCCYIMQDDILQPTLTVHETIKFAAKLKIKSRSLQEKKVKDILDIVELSGNLKSLVCNLSGGEMRKLSIAVELLTEPSVMFLDEPTSGLDISSAEKCMRALKAVASKGVMVVCSVHQPSGAMWNLFDHVYVMTSGMCTFQGCPRRLMDYLHSLNLTCPINYSPADHILEVTLEEYGNNLTRLVGASRNGASREWRHRHRQISNEGDNDRIDSEKSTLLNSIILGQKYYVIPFMIQFLILLQRSALGLIKSKEAIRIKLMIHLIVGISFGMIYWRIGVDASHVRDNHSLLFYTVAFIMFTAYSGMIHAFHLKVRITTREYFNDWYSLKAFYLAENIVDMIFQTLCSTSMCLLVYTLSGQPLDPVRFFLFSSAIAMISLISQTWGILICTVLRLKHAVVFGSLSIMPWVVFAGYFLRLEDAPWFMHWLFQINFLKYGFQCVILSVYGYNRPRLSCSKDYCHFVFPQKFLNHLQLQNETFSFNFLILVTILILSKTVTFYVLKYQLKHKRKKLDDE